MNDNKKTEPSGFKRTDTHVKPQTPWQHAGGLHKSKPDRVPMLRDEVDMIPIPHQEIISK